ncbi:hypothetical protein [Leptospira interrogans]|uniref:hypothetical protein n=1 Tax=Leptospira interrogans TaxID=173 RepID=UPI000349817E|nr:hypothetical protein [Leptospira interrogans]
MNPIYLSFVKLQIMLTYYNQIAYYYFKIFSEPNLTLFFSNPSINSIGDLNKSSMENRIKWENIGKTFSKILKFDVRNLGESGLPQAGRTGLSALVNKLHAGNIIQHIVFNSNLLTSHRSLSRYTKFTLN